MNARIITAWLLDERGSTRAVALIRIGLALMIWCAWGKSMVFCRDPTPVHAFVSTGFFVSSTLLLVGWQARRAALVCGLTIAALYYGGLEPGQAYGVFHFKQMLVVSTLLLALTPCGNSLSVDRFIALRRARRAGAPAPAESGPLWGVRLLALQVSIVYFWAALDKTSRVFLSGERHQQIFMNLYSGSDFPAWPGFANVCQGLAIAVVALEYALAFGLFVPKLRLPLMACGIIFHGLMYTLLGIHFFTLTMVVLYLAYLPPSQVHEFLDRLLGISCEPRDLKKVDSSVTCGP